MPASKGSKKSSSTRSSASRTKGGKSRAKGKSSKKRAGTSLMSKVKKAMGKLATETGSGAIVGAIEGAKEAGRKMAGSTGTQGKGKSTGRKS